MGCGEQGELAGKSGITADQRTGSVVSCELWAISHPVAWWKWPISKMLPDL